MRGTLTFAVGRVISARERPADLDHGPRLPRAGARASRTTSSATLVDTNDEWIRDRTGIRERRIAADTEAMSDISLPACRKALEMAGLEPG